MYYFPLRGNLIGWPLISGNDPQFTGGIRKVAKSCNAIGVRITDLETRTAALKVDVIGACGQTKAQESQLVGIQWKLEDQENWQRCKNLQVPGIPEDKERSDVRFFMVDLFCQAFLDLEGWNWTQEIQRALHVPMAQKQLARDDGKPQAILVYVENFLLRQIIFEKACWTPNAQLGTALLCEA
ncbi:hypothetical protein NDU88_010335 [Pleurodeles waltl]|uniref:Uncharacterized protein n=1 Tax=Pleurodeles waltl TaxID=8319 RepID=A0AAV7Q1W7_PLEWA|nr:hypothetical protein NDU88_010335 [Pleurodeles waltl]